jgi:hypothetical protein
MGADGFANTGIEGLFADIGLVEFGIEIRLEASANEGSECQIGSTVMRSGATLAQGAVVVHSRESSAPATRGNGKA